ncbi:PB1 domain containing protein [Parasponia andersonii]|uniref:PB1 domain containing protein n=1 Tax=Parasponia andersonii TaxID=3476 RepID=A0A2P5DW31_PARAD|nr:PB1 domain containing protein [Parasponia andersonii]
MDTALPPPTKLRLMCSYGGQILPRPRSKSLCYAGGETRIVSVDPLAATTLASLTAHLSSHLSIPTPFSLKYQLPNHDLDSLVSLLTDDDLLIMLEELRRHLSASASSRTPSRMRLFVFSPKAESRSSRDSVIHHPKTESWFFDALKSAKIMQKGRANCLVGFEGEAQNECGGDFSGNGIGSTAESMVLETSSSFGSTSSSASLTNLAAIKSNVEDGGSGMNDNNVKLTSPESLASESSVSAATSCPQTGAYQDPAIRTELEIKGSDISFGVQAHPVMVSPYVLNPPFDQLQQRKVQYIQPDSPYTPQHSPGVVPVSSFYPLYHTQSHQQQLVQLQYQLNQPSPVYFLPVAPTQAYNFAGYHGFIESPTLTSSQMPVHINASYIPQQVPHMEYTHIDASPNLASQVYNTANPEVAAPLTDVPYGESRQQSFGLCQNQHQSQSIPVAYRESPKHSNEVDDDLARVQIYKSQPPPPSRPLPYQSMTNATTALLSEALAQLHTDNLKQQIKTSQPQ